MLITNRVREVAASLLKGNDNTTLRHEENIQYDQALVDIARARRTIMTDLRAMPGMVKPIDIGGYYFSL